MWHLPHVSATRIPAILTRQYSKAQGITDEPQGNAPSREELIRRYNLGGKPYNAQTHIITYELVSGKELKASHAHLLGGLDIQADKTYGIAHVFKPRNEPTLGGGVLTVIYDPETGAILYAKKSRQPSSFPCGAGDSQHAQGGQAGGSARVMTGDNVEQAIANLLQGVELHVGTLRAGALGGGEADEFLAGHELAETVQDAVLHHNDEGACLAFPAVGNHLLRSLWL